MTPNEQKKTVEMESIGESYTVWTHKSGLTVFHIPKNRSETYALLAVRFGSNDGRFRSSENAPVTVLPDGTAHFLEHKMFEEPDGTDAFSLYAQSGAFANAFTSRDATCYLFSCTEGFEDNLRILLHSVTSPYFTKETVEKELDIIGEEIDMHACAPGETVHRNLLRALYHVCPVRNEIAGTRESISEMTPDLLYGCADAFYRPSNMSLTVVGNADPEAVDRICDEFLPAEGKPMTAETLPEEEPESVFQTRVEEESEIAQPLIAVGFKAPVPDSPERDMLVSAANAVNMQLLFSRSGDFFNR
ncbi:MAG: insulinase family protein, partial [Clostridia bacterium]|nr:insulinase family protein [Clostridia bacterium]